MQKFYVTLLAASLLICSFPFRLSADTPWIRVKVEAEGSNGDDARMISALSREFRKLDGVLVTDTQPLLEVSCVVVQPTLQGGKIRTGYACSVAVTDGDNHLVTHSVQTGPTIDQVAHEIATELDGSYLEKMRRDAQPSSSP